MEKKETKKYFIKNNVSNRIMKKNLVQEDLITELEEVIKYKFRDVSLLRSALTHTSYANEHKKDNLKHNERLEFLGDAILELVSSEFLYTKYPKKSEGELTKLRASMVCEPTLALCAKDWNMGKYILLGKGEEANGGRKRESIVSDAVEALIGAIYLDGGFASAKEFIYHFILKDIEHKQLFYDSKTILQEIIQGKNIGNVKYELIREEGPDHDKSFFVALKIDDKVVSEGCGHTKKAAEQQAAYKAIQILQ